jgi:membrane protein required for beta-lactamase induction
MQVAAVVLPCLASLEWVVADKVLVGKALVATIEEVTEAWVASEASAGLKGVLEAAIPVATEEIEADVKP